MPKVYNRDGKSLGASALARASSIYKRQARPLVREGAPQKNKTVTAKTAINILTD
jgi:hypothetical protein